MGIFLDTVEDNAESEGWRVESIRQKLGIPTSTPQQFPAVSCPLCPQLFFSDTELQDHIFDQHRDYCGYFSINGLILHEGRHFKERDIRELNYADLDDIVFNLQTRIDKGKRIADWAKYKTPLHQSNEHPLRKQYLTAMLEYLGAHYQEVTDQSSNYQSLSEQFGRAYGYLQPFPFHLAQQTRRSIALKMNWFCQVGDAPENSLFFWAWHFFEHEYSTVTSVTLSPTSSRQAQGIILDHFHQELLDALILYYCDRATLNHGWLVKLELLLRETTNRNYLDKLALLKARLFREWEEVNQAKQAYRSIRNHPTFGAEARAFNG